MARAPRIEQPGGIYHVTARGNNKRVIYVDDRDRVSFLTLLSRVARRHRWVIYAYCLMTNHYHLVLQILDGLSRGMCELNGSYARQTNRRHGHSDHLFRNRFLGAPVEDDGHLLQSCRYVVLNPVRAGICKSPNEWRWSSYRACAGLELAPSFLSAHELLGLFSRRPAAAARAYRSFVAASVPGTVTEVSRGGSAGT